jgi:hypothetical protein
MTITQEELQSVLDYCPETGVFKWRERKQGRRSVAGGRNPSGYIHISINYVSYPAHRLAWIYVYGRAPAHHIDHINRNPSDNRIANLREATCAENAQNKARPRNNSSGHIGVTWDKATGKWLAQIKHKGKYQGLGRYADIKDAATAYQEAKARLHVFNPTLHRDKVEIDSLPDCPPISEKAKYMPTRYPYVTASNYKGKVYYGVQIYFQGKLHQFNGFSSEEEAHAAALDIKARLESGETTIADLKARKKISIGRLSMTKKQWADYLNIDISVLYKQAKRSSFEEAVWSRLPLNERGPLPTQRKI